MSIYTLVYGNQRVNDRIDWEGGDDVTGLIPIHFELGGLDQIAQWPMQERKIQLCDWTSRKET